MSVTLWQPGTLYNPGALVSPLTAPPVVTGTLANGNFELGDLGWTKGAGWVIATDPLFYDGSYVGRMGDTDPVASQITNNTEVAVTPGLSITAQCAINLTGSSGPAALGAALKINWLDIAHTLISTSDSAAISSTGGNWSVMSVTGSAPAGAAFATFGVQGYKNSGPNFILVDAASWNYVSAPPPDGLIFRAVQANAGFSANIEPTWPTVLGNTVVDNQVTWEAVLTTRVTWEATPILVSGASEPAFPTAIGSSVADNTISWQAISRRIEDSKCPNSAAVAIASSKVFAGDDDIVAFSATINPLDWSTRDDAGYLPFGLQTYGSQPVSAMGLYRGNLVVFNATGFQMWQVDQDPANMALLDSVPVSCTYPRSVQGVSNDLIFLNAKGVRNISIAGASTNLQANAIGEPIDSLVGAKLRARAHDPIGLYWPQTGQYWLIFGDEAFILTINGSNKRSWSRYTFPGPITDWTLDGNDLVLRATVDYDELPGSGDVIWRLDPLAVGDDLRNLSFFTAATLVSNTGYIGISLGTANGSDLENRDIGHVYRSSVSSRLFFNLTNIYNSANLPTAIRIHKGSDPRAMEFIAEFAIADGSVNFPGGLGSPVDISWDDPANVFSGVTDFIVEIVELPPIEPPGDQIKVLDGLFQEFQGIMHWPHLDMGALGREKQLVGFDLVTDAPNGGVSVSIGYNQTDLTARTADYAVDADTLPGQMVPIPVSGPSFDLKLTFEPQQIWEWQAANLYVQDWRVTS